MRVPTAFYLKRDAAALIRRAWPKLVKLALEILLMRTVNMHDAKTRLSRLVEEAVRGEPFVIARAGRPLVRVEALDAPAPYRLGFLAGQGGVPEDFDRMAEDEIAGLFHGKKCDAPRGGR